MLKHTKVANTVARRIALGDYRLRRFPSVIQLAKELGINPRTVTKAVDELVLQGVLRRDDSGRIDVRSDADPGSLHIALLQPAYVSAPYAQVQRNLNRLTTARGWRIKVVSYTHWHDPAIPSALAGFDCVMFMPIAEDVPGDVIRLLASAKAMVVALDQDLSTQNIPSLQFHESTSVATLLSQLADHGHREVACLSTQPGDSVIRDRIEQWQFWTRIQRVGGRLLEHQVQPYDSPMARAYEVIDRLSKERDLSETALFCTTGAAAVGAMRALMDHGLVPGRDVSVCSADDHGGEAPYLSPRLTCLQSPEWGPYLDVCLDWFASGGGPWVGPMCVHPASMPIYVGDSTGPVRK